MTAAAPGSVLVMGAGAIGCFVGGALQLAGADVAFVGRPAALARLASAGLRLTDLGGGDRRIDGRELACGETVAMATARASAPPALVLLCVKSGGTAEAAAQLARNLPPGTLVLSLQNGIGNPALARQVAPSLAVVPGIVGFNVAELAPGHFHRGTAGELAAGADPGLAAWRRRFARAGLPLDLHADLLPRQWGKLLLNLNNPVNALSGRPLREQLLDRDFRRCHATLIDEALQALAAAGIRPILPTPLPASRLPALLRWPTPWFRLAAARLLRVDARARSSMADDLARGRPTEVDAICGEVLRLAARHGLAAPATRRIAGMVASWPAEGRTFSGPALAAAIGAS